jgi:quinol monooxygenase YgiN
MSYIMVARWRARDGDTQTIEAILRELATAVRQEPGNLQFTVHRSLDDENEFLLYEIYRSQEAFAEHQKTEHFKRLVLEQAVPLLSERERRSYSVAGDI